MDVWMPGLDGFSATERLRSDPATADVPVVCLSADTTASAGAADAGCDVFLWKPVLPDDLIEHLRAAFNKRQRRNLPE
jgi:CheY-like chemotaxis protein